MRIALLTLIAIAACATTPTAEEDVLVVVEEIRAALLRDDADAVWERSSTRYRNLHEEARRARAGEVDPATADSPWPLDLEEFGAEVTRADAGEMDAREFHRAVFEPAEDLPTVGGEAEVHFEDDLAWVDDPASRRQWVFRRENGDWKLEILLPPELYGASLIVHECPSGREVALAVMVELSRKKVHEVPLPVIHWDAELIEHHGLEVRVALDRDRHTEVRWELVDEADLKERLLFHAERQRDMEHPLQYSHVPFLLAVHRELSWRRVEEVLWLMADLDVRIRNVTFLSAEYPDQRRGVEVVLGCQARPTQVRYAEPDVEVRIGSGAATPARLAGLAKALATRPDADFGNGIRVYVSPDLPVGPALSALIVVGRSGEVVHHLAEEPFEGISLDGKPVAPTERVESAPDPVAIHLTLVIRLPPGAETPTTLFRRLVIALDREDRHDLQRLLAPSVRTRPEKDSGTLWRKAKGATLKEVTVDGDRATVSFDGPQVLGVLYLVREDGRWYLAADPPTDPR